MRIRMISLLTLSPFFAVTLNGLMGFGQSLSVDDYFGDLVSLEPVVLAASVVLALLVAAGLWVADARERNPPLLALPLCIIVALGAGYGGTELALRQASARYDILTDDCHYANALAYRSSIGIFVSSGGRTAFHSRGKIHSIHLVGTAT